MEQEAKVHKHPNDENETVFGYKLEPGDVLEEGDLFAGPATRKWLGHSLPGLKVVLRDRHVRPYKTIPQIVNPSTVKSIKSVMIDWFKMHKP